MSIGTAIVGGITGLIGANKQAKAAKQELSAQQAIANNTLQAQQQNFGDVKTAAQPFLTTADAALDNLKDPSTSFQTSPGYEFRVNQAGQGALQSSALNGLLNSGSALKAYNDYVGNTASGEYNNWYNQRLGTAQLGTAGLSSLGQAAAGISSALQNNANALSGAQSNYTADSNSANNSLLNTVNSTVGNLFSNPSVSSLGNSLYNSFKSSFSKSASAPTDYFSQPTYSI